MQKKLPWLIIGLGNPGKEYEGTRHNIGRDTVSLSAKKLAPEKFEAVSKVFALVLDAKIGHHSAVFLLPESFMNKSGAAVGPAIRLYKGRALW